MSRLVIPTVGTPDVRAWAAFSTCPFNFHSGIACVYIAMPGFPRGSAVKNLPANATDSGSVPGLGRSPGGGHGNPLQYSCLETPMDRGAWQATVHGVTESQTRLRTEHAPTHGMWRCDLQNFSTNYRWHSTNTCEMSGWINNTVLSQWCSYGNIAVFIDCSCLELQCSLW